jgi:hypothetical protein
MKRFNAAIGDRLSHYGIQEGLLKDKSVTLGKDSQWDDHGAPFNVKVIKTSNIDEIKNLIGIPDEHITEESENPEHKDAANLTSVTNDTVTAAANAYVFGNSKKVKHLKSGIEEAIGEVRVHVMGASEIVIDKKLVVSGSDPKVIAADKIIFKDQGQIYNVGSLSLSAGTLVNLESK